MVWNKIEQRQDFCAEARGPSNIDEMLAFVELTKPGPFGRRTPEMGRYLRIHEKGQLAAMAGERLGLRTRKSKSEATS